MPITRHAESRPLDAPHDPTCPACRYDLSGIPEGRCPECGEPFTHESLARAAQERRSWRSAAPEFLIILPGVLWLLFGFDEPESLGVATFIWTPALIWFGLRRRRISDGSAPTLLLWLLWPATITAINALGSCEPLLPMFAAAAGIAIFAVDGALGRGRALGERFLFTTPAAGLLVIGAWMFTENLFDMLAGRHWSAWFDSPYDAAQYPPTTSEAVRWSLWLLGAGSLCALLRWWSVHAAAGD